MSTPYMKLFVSDYLGDTRHLTTEQHGAYLLLLMAMWNAGGHLPNDNKKLAKIAGCNGRRWASIKDEVMEFFDVSDATVTNSRLSEEYKKAVHKRESMKRAGRKGGYAKSLKNKETDLANARQMPGKCQQHHSHIDTSVSSPSSEEEDTALAAPETVSVEHDPKAFIWSVGVAYVTGRGVKDGPARSAIGKLVKTVGLAEAERVITAMQASGTGDPLSYIAGAAQKRSRQAATSGEPRYAARFSISREGDQLVKRDIETGEIVSRESAA